MDEKEKLNYKREVAIRRMALFIIIICFAYLAVSSFVIVPAEGKDYSNSIVGIILLLIGFYWGSSSGSTARGETIDKQLEGVLPPRSTTAITKTVTVDSKSKTETTSEPPAEPKKEEEEKP
jgi:hypothetical protein